MVVHLQRHLDGTLFYDILVDTWPEWNAVLIRRHLGKSNEVRFYTIFKTLSHLLLFLWIDVWSRFLKTKNLKLKDEVQLQSGKDNVCLGDLP